LVQEPEASKRRVGGTPLVWGEPKNVVNTLGAAVSVAVSRRVERARARRERGKREHRVMASSASPERQD
jgi:hypothetical protein